MEWASHQIQVIGGMVGEKHSIWPEPNCQAEQLFGVHCQCSFFFFQNHITCCHCSLAISFSLRSHPCRGLINRHYFWMVSVDLIVVPMISFSPQSLAHTYSLVAKVGLLVIVRFSSRTLTSLCKTMYLPLLQHVFCAGYLFSLTENFSSARHQPNVPIDTCCLPPSAYRAKK